jgi:hypothetical protein
MQSLLNLRFENGSVLKQLSELGFTSCEVLATISIPASVERLCSRCFWACYSLSSVFFEPGSKLRQIGDTAFPSCTELLSISVPPSIRPLDPNWLTGSLLKSVLFESGKSLRRLLESGQMCVEPFAKIYIPINKRNFTYPGYSVQDCFDVRE